MDTIKIYQSEKYEYSDNDQLVDSALLQIWNDGAGSITLFGIDGNTLFETSIMDVIDENIPDEYMKFIEPLNVC